MKHIYIVGGTMGVGKTTTCQHLKEKLSDAVFLDGDWCWDANPFTVTDETKRMVMDNICHLLNNFIGCSAYKNIIFCWVMHEQKIIDEIVSGIDISDCVLYNLSLVCTPDALVKRIGNDVNAGKRKRDVMERSLARLPLYEKLDTVKIDVSDITPAEAAEKIISLM